jgi:hypothetical protein
VNDGKDVGFIPLTTHAISCHVFPDFEQPTHWSSIVRKAKTRLNKGKDLEEPIFSKGKVSDIGPCCQILNIHVNDLHSNLTLSNGHPLTVGAFPEITKIRGKD